MSQLDLFSLSPSGTRHRSRPRAPLLKWIGSKFRVAEEITSYAPSSIGRFFDVFLGSGAVLATIAPRHGIGSDVYEPLVEIWTTLQRSPTTVIDWYRERWLLADRLGRPEGYEAVKASFNAAPNGPDFLFLSRACYGGVIRFRKADGYMSTPCGTHNPISPETFAQRAQEWHSRLRGCQFLCASFESVMRQATAGDFIYCDPPYSHTQSILYGAQTFDLQHLLVEIDSCKSRGVNVALSIDGSKKSGSSVCHLPIPPGLFERQIHVDCGRSMLRRFQMNGQTLEDEVVTDRLLLTY